MKNLILMGGPMGVDKTAACQLLKRRLGRCVFLDGDWCWDMHPFQVTEETKPWCWIIFVPCSAIFCVAPPMITYCSAG